MEQPWAIDMKDYALRRDRATGQKKCNATTQLAAAGALVGQEDHH